jgi:hypothetical protein
MRNLLYGLGMWIVCGLIGTQVQGQIALQLSMEREHFLVYEDIPLIVTVHNLSNRPVKLVNHEDGRSWLEVQVFRGEADLIKVIRPVTIDDELVVPPRQSLSRLINLTPLYDLRSRGLFRVQAMIQAGDITAASPVLEFSLMNGREIARQLVGVSGATTAEDGMRVYSLQVRQTADHGFLYVCVRDDDKGMVYAMLPMGLYIPLEPPMTMVDRDTNLHVMLRSGPRQMGYAKIDAYGRILDRAIYSDDGSSPGLVRAQEGSVRVQGGEKIFPREERVMTTEELNPTPPPPPGQKAKP